jgi:glucokinase
MTGESTSGRYFLGIDLGGTNVKAGVVDDGGHSRSSVSRPTEAAKGPEHGMRNIYRVADDAVSTSGVGWDEIAAIGVATPGTMDIPAGMLLHPHNLPGWDELPIRQLVADQFDKPAILQNDASAAAYGEYWVGAARDGPSLVFWTLGTGIGSGIIVNDMIIQGEHSCGSECGHIIIDMDGTRTCATGQYGTLEAYASAKSLMARCQEALKAGRESRLRQLQDQGVELTPLVIGNAAEHGDELAEELVMDTAKYLGIGTVSIMHAVNPTMFLIGGAMTFGRHETPLGRRFLERIREEVRARAFPIPAAKTLIDFASLGSEAGYIGAAGCARQAFSTH